MRLALIFNPFTYKLHEENLKIVQRYFGLFPPLSLAWVAAIAEKAGYTASIIDARTMRLTREDVLDRLKEFEPDILGFMMTTYMYQETLEWIRFLKKHLKIPVVIGGYNLRVYPKESVLPDEIDFGVFNSAFYTIPSLLGELETNRNFHDVPGLVYKNEGKIQVTPSLHEKFEDYPFPARHLLPNELYAEFPTERKNFTVLVSSKGCPMGCLFCEAKRTLYNPRSPETVVNEIEECYTKYNVREIDIFDYEFCINKKRIMDICKRLQERKLDLIWACRTRIDSVDEELLREMKKAGCNRIYYGIESGDQEMLDRLNKGITLEKIRENILLTKYYGIRALGFFLIGSPGETRESIRKTLKFAKSLKLDYVQFSKTTAKPLTSLWKRMVEDSGKDYWKDYILGEVEEGVLPRPWTELSNQEIDRITKMAYISYHTGPAYVVRQLSKLRSFEEFKRKVNAGLEMLFRQESHSKKDENFVAYHDRAVRKAYFRKVSKWSQPF